MVAIATLVACEPKPDLKKVAKDIRQAEEEFAKLADEKGVAVGFYEFAAEEAVINRGGLITKDVTPSKPFMTPSKKQVQSSNGRPIQSWYPKVVRWVTHMESTNILKKIA